MDVRITGWRYHNIRGGLRNVAVELGSPPPRWTLVQMPNGTGKTTTMALFRAVLAEEELTPETVAGFRPTDETERGEFELKLLVGGQLHRLFLRLNYEDGTATYWTSRAELSGGGFEEGLNLPRELKNLISPDFARLFVFDGELAKEIRKDGLDRAAWAVRVLYRLDRLHDLTAEVKRLVTLEQERAAAFSSAQTKGGLKNLQGRLDTARNRFDALTREVERLRKRIRESKTREADLSSRVHDRISQDEGLRKRLEEATQERRTVESQIASVTAETLSALRNPAVVHARVLARLQGLGGKMEQLKLPKTISAEFFRELARQEVCVCGRAIGEEERRAIEARAPEYLAENQIGVINAMKSAVRDSEADPTTIDHQIGSLDALIRDRKRLDGELERLEAERLASGDAELEKLKDDLKIVRQRLKEDGDAYELLTTRDPNVVRANALEWKDNLPLCEKERDACEERLHKATNTRRFLVQARRTEALIATIENAAFERLCDRVRDRTNEKLPILVPSEHLRVSRIRGALELESSRLATKSGVSEGQSLSVAYAFLTSLFEDAPYRLPFIVDSPAISLDNAVRREVGQLVPELFDQMIMFVISSERPGFADSFYKRPNVRYVTLRKTSEETADVNYEQDFFRNFHDEDEEGADPAAGDPVLAGDVAP
jgi:DNA sulfur modification protein DndD